MNADDPVWTSFPVLRELFRQWHAKRGRGAEGIFRQPFWRNWESLLEDAGLLSGEARAEADRDARLLATAGLVELKTVRFRSYQIERLSVPFAAEPRLRALFANEFPEEILPRFDAAAVDWQPELAFLRTVRTGVASEDLLKLNAFFASREAVRPDVPVKERSLEIFGDEKRLDALRNTALFDPERLTLDQLGCFAVPEPLGWKRGPRGDGPLLVIENACTWDSYCRWNAERGFFSAVVYGCGNRFCDSAVRLDEIFAETGGPRRVLYFGDLDPQGLRIPQIASRRIQRQGLSAIEPDFWSYARLLEIASGKETPALDVEPLADKDFAWLGDLAPPVKTTFDSGLRIAQEHLGWEYLSQQSRTD